MLPKNYRLTYKEYIQNKKPPKKLTSNHFDLFIKPTKGKNSKILVITPKTIDKRSSFRHMTKRIIIEAIKEVLDKVKKNSEIMIKAKKVIMKKDRMLIKREIELLLLKIT